jgi:hypothetical protein
MTIIRPPALIHAAVLVAAALAGGLPVLFDLRRMVPPDDAARG